MQCTLFAPLGGIVTFHGGYEILNKYRHEFHCSNFVHTEFVDEHLGISQTSTSSSTKFFDCHDFTAMSDFVSNSFGLIFIQGPAFTGFGEHAKLESFQIR